MISGVPTGASLSAGTDNGDGTWTLTQGQLTGLTLTPPSDSDADFTLTVTSTSTDGGDTAQTVDTFDVTVTAVADAPTVTANDVAGNEDTAIALDVTSALSDTDGSETLSVVVSGVPTGASLSAGTDNGDGTWTLTQGQLTGLSITPPADSDADFTLTVTSTSTDGADTAQTVNLTAVADVPTVRPTTSRIRSMISVKGASFGRFGGWRRRYPGGSECRSIFFTVSRAMPNRLDRLSLAHHQPPTNASPATRTPPSPSPPRCPIPTAPRASRSYVSGVPTGASLSAGISTTATAPGP